MKNYRIISTALALLSSISILAQNIPWEIREKLHPVIYPFTIDPKTANEKYNDVGRHTPLSEEYGFVIIPPSAYCQKEDHGGSLGILVAHLPGDRYVSCELRCARCLYEYRQHNKMTPMKSISPGKVLGFFECKKCGVQLDGVVYTGNTCLSHHEYQETTILTQEGYVVETIRDEYGYIKELRITNSVAMLEHLDREKNSEPRRYIHKLGREDYFPYKPKNEFR